MVIKDIEKIYKLVLICFKEIIYYMKKIAVVYWSGTGHTEAMANAVANGVEENGARAELIKADSFHSDMMDEYSAIAFGCPSMGNVLEETVFEPMFNECKPKLSGKRIALFGSYGWSKGRWMEKWTEICKENGADIATDYVICLDRPDKKDVKDCIELGKALA